MSTAIAHALHDVADAIRSLKSEEIQTTVNVTGGAIPTGEAIALAVADDLGFTPLEPQPIKGEETLLEELRTLPAGAYADLFHPRRMEEEAAKRKCIDGTLMFDRVYVAGADGDEGASFRFRDTTEDDYDWFGRAEQARGLGLTAADFVLPNEEPEEDIVAAPNHYRRDDEPECIEMTAGLDFVWGSVVKYVYRCLDKGNPVQDLEKALRYLEFAEERGLEKPVDNAACEIYLGAFLVAEDYSTAERRASTMMTLFSDGEAIADVRNEIENLVEAIKEEEK